MARDRGQRPLTVRQTVSQENHSETLVQEQSRGARVFTRRPALSSYIEALDEEDSTRARGAGVHRETIEDVEREEAQLQGEALQAITTDV